MQSEDELTVPPFPASGEPSIDPQLVPNVCVVVIVNVSPTSPSVQVPVIVIVAPSATSLSFIAVMTGVALAFDSPDKMIIAVPQVAVEKGAPHVPPLLLLVVLELPSMMVAQLFTPEELDDDVV